MADKRWPALLLHARRVLTQDEEDLVAVCLDDFAPTAIQDLAELPLPPGGIWDPTQPPPPDPPPAPLRWRVFFSSTADRDAARHALASALPALDIAAEEVSDEDWAARSQRALTAIRAGRFLVAPPWDTPDAGAHGTEYTLVVIEPSRGFGTGHHASTRLCLRAISGLDLRGKRVLDVGTGSGVLAIAAALSGARTVLAIDADTDAIESARRSAALNPDARGIDWLIADLRDTGWDALLGGPWDVVLANLTGGLIAASAERLKHLVRADGVLVCSGFGAHERETVERALGLHTSAAYEEEGWVGLTLSRST